MNAADQEALLCFAESHPLSQAISAEDLPLYAKAGAALGEAVAAGMRESFAGLTPSKILEREGVEVKTVEAPLAEGVQVLAVYRAEPPTVRVFPGRIEHIRRKLQQEGRHDLAERLSEIALAHELYHHLWHSTCQGRCTAELANLIRLSCELPGRGRPEALFHSPLTQEMASLSFVKSLFGLPELPLL